jgi:CheY-like chemotaxis protein
MRLLVVEDNEELAQLLAQRLQAAGYETDLLTTAAEAQTAVTTTRYAAMVLDLGLPDADGLSVLRELRRRKDPARQETFLQLHKQCSCLALSSTVADDVIGIPLERYVRMRFRHPPVEHILQKQVRQQWTYYAPLWCSPLSQKIEAIEGIVPARHSLVGRRAATGLMQQRSACRLEGQGQRRADLSPAWGRAFAPAVRRAKDFKLVPQEMPQSKM